MKKRSFIVFLLSILLVLFTSCRSDEEENGIKVESDNVNEVYGHETISASVVAFKTVNPVLNAEKSLSDALKLVYDGLFEIDEKDNIVPRIAKSYTWNRDAKSIAIDLKDNIKWHDGQDLTAEDVKFTIERIKDRPDSPYSELVNEILSVEVHSPQRIFIEFTKTDTSLLRNFVFPIIPKHKLAGLSEEEFERDSNNLVGSGMYKITDFKKRNMIVLKRYEEYYSQKPEIDTLRLLIVPDRQAQYNMFMSKEVDFYDDDMFFSGKYSDMNVRTIDYFSGELEFLAFNIEREPFSDLAFRKALISGIDRNRILEEVYLGRGEVVDMPLNPQSALYDKSIGANEYDPAKSKNYFEQNHSNVKPLELLVNGENDQRVKSAYAIKSLLGDSGLEINVVEKESEDYFADIAAGYYDMVMAGWHLPLSGVERYCFHSSGKGNILRYSSEKADSIIDKLELAKNGDEMVLEYSNLQSTIKTEAPYLPIVFKKHTLVVSDRMIGVSTPSRFDIYRGIQEFSTKYK